MHESVGSPQYLWGIALRGNKHRTLALGRLICLENVDKNGSDFVVRSVITPRGDRADAS